MRIPGVRRGFTLVEIMVSLGIFSVIGVIIMSVLLAATRLFRGAEAAKASSDEAVTVLSLLRDDLRRIIPEKDGGWFHAHLTDNSGNGCVAFVTTPADPTALNDKGSNSRELVVWWTYKDGRLFTDKKSINIGLNSFRDDRVTIRGITELTEPLFSIRPVTVTRGALHFSPWIAKNSATGTIKFHRLLDSIGRPDWEGIASRDTEPQAGPWRGEIWDTDPDVAVNPVLVPPWPTALRIAVTLAGGGTLTRDRISGQVELDANAAGNRDVDRPFLADNGLASDKSVTTLRTRGGAIPSGPGNAFRVGDEWMTVTSLDGPGVVTVARKQRRSLSATHARGASILIGQTFSVVWRMGE